MEPTTAPSSSLLRTHLAAPPEVLAPLLLDAAQRQGPMGRVYVRVEGAGDRPGAALLEWLARLYRAVADLAPRLDVVPLLPFAGWDDAAVDALVPPPSLLRGGAAPSGQPDAASAASEQAAVSAPIAPPAPSPPSTTGREEGGRPPSDPDQQLFDHVAVGGTFDRLHAGHRLLLAATALAASRRVYVGITADELLSKKAHREWLQPYEARRDAALEFMRAVRPGVEAQAGALSDPSAPTQAELDEGMQALVVSRETLAGGEAINRGRVGRGFAPLRLLVVGVVGERADGSKLSSSELRERDATSPPPPGSGSGGGGGGN